MESGNSSTDPVPSTPAAVVAAAAPSTDAPVAVGSSNALAVAVGFPDKPVEESKYGIPDREKRQDQYRKRKADCEWKSSNKRSRNNEPAGGFPNRKLRENPFSAEEIASEERKPKKKVAVLIGYSGTGYKGMQINDQEKTIEGDLFKAFVAAGGIAKVNADDHKKSSLMRCARTDKGVHAAGNVISLKLIQEPDMVEKINENLPPQIRVWGIERTNNQFNCYKSCDSRWYEYLLPSYSLLPPHPESYLGKKIWEQAMLKGVTAQIEEKIADVKGFWEEVDEKEIKPILAGLDSEIRTQVLARMHASESLAGGLVDGSVEDEQALRQAKAEAKHAAPVEVEAVKTETTEGDAPAEAAPMIPAAESTGPREPTAVDFALRDIKYAYIAAKRRYRVTSTRLDQLQAVLNKYLGTHNFYNYTVRTEFKDASAKRHIRSFEANKTPIFIGNTEWISLKVHGQSFMMHQIRKMVGLACLVTRCGSPLSTIDLTYEGEKMAIPKAPSLSLLLERPVFDTYNNKATTQLGRDSISFDKYMDKILPFKNEYIYSRIYEIEEKDSSFHEFFQQVDNFKSPYFLWLTAGGLEAARVGKKNVKVTDKMHSEEGDEEKGDP